MRAWSTSRTEARFADQLEKNDAVGVYAKLPGWFQVKMTRSYNPDWAVLADSDDGERLYFVVETKGSPFLNDLRSRHVTAAVGLSLMLTTGIALSGWTSFRFFPSMR